MLKTQRLYAFSALLVVFCVVHIASGQTPDNTAVIAISGDLSPDGNGELATPEAPVLHNGGNAVFAATLRTGVSSAGSGIFSGNGTPGSLTLLVREGDPTPNLDGNFAFFNNPALRVNGSNQVAFQSLVFNPLDPRATEGFFVAGGPLGGVTEIARANQPEPGGDGRFAFPWSDHTFNDAGQVAFVSFLIETSAGGSSPGIFRGDGSPDGLTEIVRVGHMAPDGVGHFTAIRSIPFGPPMNESGQVLFEGQIQIQDPFSSYRGMFRGDGGSITEIVRNGGATPSGNGTFGEFEFLPVAFNNAGEATFVATLNDTAMAASDNLGLFRGDGMALTEIVRKGDPVPGGDGRFLVFLPVSLNDAGQVLFVAGLSGASGGDMGAVFIGNGEEIIPITRLGDAAPNGEGTFSGFDLMTMAFNNAGQAVFLASVDVPDRPGMMDTMGIFFYDPQQGVLPVAQTGHTLADQGEISALTLNGGSWYIGDEGSGLNDQGQVAYRFTAGGNIGIAIWSAVSATPPPM
jgi:hypothetical protein